MGFHPQALQRQGARYHPRSEAPVPHAVPRMHTIFEHPEPQHARARGQSQGRSSQASGRCSSHMLCHIGQKEMERGRYFVYEHPKSAASWDNPRVDGLASTPGVMRTELDQCEFGLTSEDELGRAPAKKPTSLLTNSAEVDRMMGVKCRRGHRRVHPTGGRARAAAHYPARFCRSVCKVMKRQARVDASGMLWTLILAAGRDEVGKVAHIPQPWKKCWDDIFGK